MFEDHFKTYHCDSIHVYTDGSKSDAGVGAAGIVGNDEKAFKLSVHATIYSAELYAILKALQAIDNSFNMKFTIFTDSKSSMQKINRMYSNHPIISKIQSWLIRLESRHK